MLDALCIFYDLSGVAREMVLVDYNKDKTEGEAMDLSHGVLFVSPITNICWRLSGHR
ncbi:MAG: hypothetical protein LBP57_00990 [Endomicrobium sp.]|jgi:malate/lactate dehydrogenase|nr:hypothetical protein [Endomicrobium sp.]